MNMDIAEQQMQRMLADARQRVSQILGAEKSPKLASQVEHTYEDKYLLTEFLCNMGLASQLTCLGHLGLRVAQLEQLKAWANTGAAVSLRIRTEEKCTFLRTEKREVEAPTKTVVVSKDANAQESTVTSRVISTVTENWWQIEHAWELLALRGTGSAPADVLRVGGRKGHHDICTSSKRSPQASNRSPSSQEDWDITWLLQQLTPHDSNATLLGGSSGSGEVPSVDVAANAGAVDGMSGASFVPRFAIDRSAETCATPRRNAQTEAAITHATQSREWFNTVDHLTGAAKRILTPDEAAHIDLKSLEANGSVFVPVLPVFADSNSAGTMAENDGTNACLDVAQVASFLAEEARSLAEKCSDVEATFSASSPTGAPNSGHTPGQAREPQQLFTAAEGIMVAVCSHAHCVASQWLTALDYVEVMLYNQLRAAIGATVTPQLFDNYMAFHRAHRLFAPEYAPKPFCLAVRRSSCHSPEGTLSIEASSSNGKQHQPVDTLVALRSPSETDTTTTTTTGFQVSASTRIEFQGPRYLHAWLRSSFGGSGGGGVGADKESVAMVASARQFCSFVVVVGTLSTHDTMTPTHAFLVKNRDEVRVPLELATLPTAGEFRDAVQSLSPEQQAFAKAVRGYQLASTLFAVATIQIKPAMEQVLNLPPDALTKEIALTDSLVELFVKHQAPADLLSYDAAVDGRNADNSSDATPAVSAGRFSDTAMRLAAVKTHVADLRKMIEATTDKELAERRREAEYAQPLFTRTPPPAPDDDLLLTRAVGSSGKGGGSYGKGGGKGGDRAFNAPMMRTARGLEAAPRGLTMAQSSMEAPTATMAAVPQQAATEVARELPPTEKPAVDQDFDREALESALRNDGGGGSSSGGGGGAFDLTTLPAALDAACDAHAPTLRPTTISLGATWTKRAAAALLATPRTATLNGDAQAAERRQAFDLLDALSRSGAQALPAAELHVVVAVTERFEDSVVDTVVQRSLNPIERGERAALVVAAAVHGLSGNEGANVAQLVAPQHLARVQASVPDLFEASSLLPAALTNST